MPNKNPIVREIMTTNMAVVHPKDKLKVVRDYFDNNDFHHIPVVVMGEVKGIISLGDLLFLERKAMDTFDEFLMTKKYEMATADEIMTSNPITVSPDATLLDALNTMLDQGINALPVVDDGAIVGIVTSEDMLRYLKTLIN